MLLRLMSPLACTCRPRLVASVLFVQPSRCYFEGKYRPGTEEKILNLLNNCEEVDQLLKFSISKRNGAKILERRKEVGEYKSLNDPLSVVPSQLLEKFYKSVANDGRKGKGYRGSPINPPLSEEAVAQARRVVSFSCVGGRVMWSSMERMSSEVELTDIVVKQLPGKPRQHFLQLLQAVKRISEDIPSADVYVVDEYTAGMPSATQINYIVQRTQMRAFLLGLLASRSNESQFVAVKTLAVARLFELLVGSERVSGQRIVEEVMESQEIVRVREQIRWRFANAAPEERELMSNTFLLNLAYWQLTDQIPKRNKEETGS